VGGQVDEVRAYYFKESKEKELLRYLLLIENINSQTRNYIVED